MILIRADANEKTGAGHVMRCIAIAEALKQCGQQVLFLTADQSGARLLEGKNQACEILHSDYTCMEEELICLDGVLTRKKPDFFLVDSYFVTPEYLQKIREYVPVGILDDKILVGYPVDVLINYNIFAEKSLYEASGEKQAQYLLGLEYVPLRGEFAGIDYRVREKAKRVLITTGGSDRYNLTAKLLRRVLEKADTAGLTYMVISGAYNAHFEELEKLAGNRENVCIYSNVDNMSQLMSECDIAVSAGGSTMYELSAVGVPVICFAFVDNQERIVKGFMEKGLACFGGNYLIQGEAMLDDIVSQIARLAADFKLRENYSQRLRGVVDGQGAMRIAKELCRFLKIHCTKER